MQIQWLIVLAIALVQGVISVTWIIYRAYLPDLLVDWGLTKELAANLIIIETLLGILVEPFFGSLSDRQQRWLGTRFPLISLGVILASAFFIALPILVILGANLRQISWILPVTAVAWALATTIFRSPVYALLFMSAPKLQLPLAVSVLTVITGLIGTFRKVINDFILSLGSMFAFTFGSIILLGSVAFLRQLFKYFDSRKTSELERETLRLNQIIWSKLALISLIALGMSWGIRLLMGTFVKTVDNPQTMITIGIISAIASFPIAILILKIGNYKGMLLGVIGSILIFLLLTFLPNSFSLVLSVIILLISSNFLFNGTIPLIIDWMPSNQIGLGIGVYYGSFSAANSLFDIILKPDITTPIISIITCVIAWILVAISIQLGYCYRLTINE